MRRSTTAKVVRTEQIESRYFRGARDRRDRSCYDGFHVLCKPSVSRVPPNGIALHRKQLRQNHQHVLEHNQLHVSPTLQLNNTQPTLHPHTINYFKHLPNNFYSSTFV